MDWTGYPKALAPDDLVADPGDLARYLGGDETSFTGDVLALVAKALMTPDNLARLTVAFPREVVAYVTRMSLPEPPTAAYFTDVLTSVPDPDAPPPPVDLVPLIVDRVQLVRLTGGTQAALTVKGRLSSADPWRSWQWEIPSPAVGVDARLLSSTQLGAALTLRLTCPEPAAEPPVESGGPE